MRKQLKKLLEPYVRLFDKEEYEYVMAFAPPIFVFVALLMAIFSPEGLTQNKAIIICLVCILLVALTNYVYMVEKRDWLRVRKI